MSRGEAVLKSNTVFGHPAGLFTLFFVEMWERFSYYGMRALLVFYMTKGFLQAGDEASYAIYGAYTALVYAGPFLGGMLADRLLGARRSVVMGGLLIAAGQLLLTVANKAAFFAALGLLITGNSFFKPNISTIVGSLYPKGSPRKDAGFTIFYMGINLGAALSPVLCGYVGETFGWHYGFGLAAVGMLIGIAVFAAPTWLAQLLILSGAVSTAIGMPFFQDSFLQLAVRLFLSASLLVAAVVAIIALRRGGIPAEAGLAKDPGALQRKWGGLLRADLAVYLGIVLTVPLVATIIAVQGIAGGVLVAVGASALGYILYQALFRCGKVERERLYVALVMIFFSILFWAFFEQAGSSLNNFADRNVDRVFPQRRITAADVGSTLLLRIPQKTADPELLSYPPLTQQQLGYRLDGKIFTLSDLMRLRAAAAKENATEKELVLSWKVTGENVGMGVGGAEIPASEFQAANAIFILLFGLVFSALWAFLGARGWEPSTPVKFSLGLFQLALGFVALWYGAHAADSRGMVAMSWLLLAYLFHTTGELCLSPVGLSMITKLSPLHMVSTVMGAWFMANAFANYLAGIIAKSTVVVQEGQAEQLIPPPSATVDLYGSVYGKIALAAIAASLLCLALSPLLNRWMHLESQRTP